MVSQFLYISDAVFPIGHETDHEILEQSRARNRELGLTGYLCRTDRNFVQILEGPMAAVLTVAESIRRDKRHWHVQEWPISIVPERCFPDWGMGYGPGDRDHLLSLIGPHLSCEEQRTFILERLKAIAAAKG